MYLNLIGCTFQVQSNRDYSKCQGPPDFLRIMGSSNFRNRYFSEMFGSFRLVLIFDCVSIKNGEQGITTRNELTCIFLLNLRPAQQRKMTINL